MIQAVSSSPSYQPAPQAHEPKTASLAASGLPETSSPFDIALQIQDIQVDNLKRTLDAQTLVLDLLA